MEDKISNRKLATDRFDGYAKDYTKGRPGYAEELIDCFYRDHGITSDSVIADIGSGTGKFAVHLLARGSKVFAVEPNSDMRTTAEKELSCYENYVSVSGGAEDTTLPDRSVDFITTAQAFHWFDVVKFREECHRILKEKGKVFHIWNVRDMEDKINQELYEIYRRYCPDFVGFAGGIRKDDERIDKFYGGRYDYVEFPHPLTLGKEKFIARSLSGSYSIKEGDKDYEAYMAAIEDVFIRYEKDGAVTLGNKSVAYIGCV